MNGLLSVLLLGVAAGALIFAASRLETRPGFGVWYGIAKLTGARLDIGPTDFATLIRRASPNDALVCPPERCPHAKPDAVAPVYAMPPAQLLARLRRVALAEPGVEELPRGADSGGGALRLVQRSRLFRYPDTIDIEVFPAGAGGSTLAIYSRSLVGYGDMGVNRARVTRWLAQIDTAA